MKRFQRTILTIINPEAVKHRKLLQGLKIQGLGDRACLIFQ